MWKHVARIDVAWTNVAWTNVAQKDVAWTNVVWSNGTGPLVNSEGWFHMLVKVEINTNSVQLTGARTELAKTKIS